MKRIFIISIVFFICSCGGPSLKKTLEIASKIGAELGAKNCVIGYSADANTDHGSKNQVSIEIEGLGKKLLAKPRSKTASVAVMMYYQNLDQKEPIKYEETKVEINVGKDHYEKVFAKTEIERVFRLFKPLNLFFDMVKSNDFSTCQQITDTTYISDSAVIVLKKATAEIDSIAGKLTNVVITGFAADKIKGSGEPVTCFSAEATNGNQLVYYTFYFLDENEKLIHVGINQDMDNTPGKTETIPPTTPQTPQSSQHPQS